MTRRERLLATLRGAPVDRPAVSFYEIGGFAVDPDNPDPFNVYNDPSWRPLLELTERETDLIRMGSPATRPVHPGLAEDFFTTRATNTPAHRTTHTVLAVGGRTLTQTARRDRETNTVWVTEHLLKDREDLQAYLQLPDELFAKQIDIQPLRDAEQALGDRGIVMVDTPDPLCLAAGLFSMEDFTMVAFTERDLFHRLLGKLAVALQAQTAEVARTFPGRLWRIYGPEYASEPFLPNALFREYCERYTKPMLREIRAHGGFPRIHCHGRIRNLLPLFVAMGAAATDPIEPPPQGDIGLREVRDRFGSELVLFGNLEITDIENLPPPRFAEIVRRSLADGVGGKGFVLMPSAAPYGRTITPTTLANYETMVRLAQDAVG